MIGVSTVAPMTGCNRRTVQVTAGWRRANASTRRSSSATSRWKRVRSVAPRASCSVKKAGASGCEP